MKQARIFASETIDAVRAAGNTLRRPGGEIRLPKAFGFCRGVTRALAMLQNACREHAGGPGRLFLLGQIIHNPWVNNYFADRGVRILNRDQVARAEDFLTAADVAVIPAFGVPADVEARLNRIGCRVVDTCCGNVRRLWTWACGAAEKGFGVLIFGRAGHDETLVIRSRLAAAGGKYLVVGDLAEAGEFADLLSAGGPPGEFARLFGPSKTNAETLDPFGRLAQVSQTTMLYDGTRALRQMLRSALARRYGPGSLDDRFTFERTVCRATQDRQSAAVELCRGGCDLVVVVGGFGSSNTRHLYELARAYVPAFFIEDAGAIESRDRLRALDTDGNQPVTVRDWLPRRRRLRIGVLAGASSPEIVVGQVIEKLGGFLG